MPEAAGAAGRVGIVVVSHSTQIAAGTIALPRQMAPDVSLEAAGGTDDDAIGTSFDRVDSAVRRLIAGGGAVLLCDLGSAVMTAETVLELLEPDARARVRIADAPIVEGSVAAAVAAQTGGSLSDVVGAAEAAAEAQRSSASHGGSPVDAASGRYARTATLINDDGLHARPAAEFVRLAATFPTKITVDGKDAKSLLGIMSLGLMKGATVRIEAEPEGAAAVDALVALIESGFTTRGNG